MRCPRPRARSLAALVAVVTGLHLAPPARAARVFLNPSNQWDNSVCGGASEADYALSVANRARDLLVALGHTVIVDQDFYNAPSHANNWGADLFVSVHSNAGGGHGIETLYSVNVDIALAADINDGLIGVGGHSHVIDRGIKYRDNLWVLNQTWMPSCLTEMLFHDCCPVEAPFLISSSGRDLLAAGIRDGVCAYLGGCQVCAAGDIQSRWCPECGTQSRICTGSGQWGAWGACGGGGSQSQACPECGVHERTCTASGQWSAWGACHDGGGQPCSVTNEHGTCPGAQTCSAAGYWDACQGPVPRAERCDGRDDDCDGEVDEDEPGELGDPPPTWAARLVDASYPAHLLPGETALVWGLFENVGSATWPEGQVWLVATPSGEDESSRLRSAADWSAWDVPTVVEHDVEPGDLAVLAFVIEARDEPGVRITETFRLHDPEGEPLRCPTPRLTIDLQVGARTTAAVRAEPGPGDPGPATTGGCASTSAPVAAGVPVVLALLLGRRLLRRRRIAR